jgi:hypothetical protein
VKSSSLKRSKSLARKQQRQRPKTAREWELERVAREAWKRSACRVPCVMCLAFPPPDRIVAALAGQLRIREGHHVVAQRHLKRAGLWGSLWDSDNAMCLCRYHHARHEHAVQRVPRHLVPAAAIAFAQRLGLVGAIEREYPDLQVNHEQEESDGRRQGQRADTASRDRRRSSGAGEA